MSGDFTRSNCCCLVNMQLAVFKLHCCWQLFLSFHWHSSALHQTIWSVLYIAWAMIPFEYAVLVGDLYAYQGCYYQYNVYNLLQILENFGKFLNFKIAFAARGVLACLESSKIVLSAGFCAGSRWVSLRRSPKPGLLLARGGGYPIPHPIDTFGASSSTLAMCPLKLCPPCLLDSVAGSGPHELWRNYKVLDAHGA